MKVLTHPVPILALAVAVGAAVLSNLPMMILGLVVAVASVGLLSAREVQADRRERGEDNLSGNAAVLIQPIRMRADRIEALYLSNRDAPPMQIVGAQTVESAKSILAGSVALVNKRQELTKIIRLAAASVEVGELQKRIEEIDANLAEASRALDQLFQGLTGTLTDSQEGASNDLRERIAHASAVSKTLNEVDSLIRPFQSG